MWPFLALLAGTGLGYVLRVLHGNYSTTSAEAKARLAAKEAKIEAEGILKEARIQAKAEVLKTRDEFERSTESKRREMAAVEERLTQRESLLDRKVSMLDKKEQVLDQKIADTEQRETELRDAKTEVDKTIQAQKETLQRIAGMSQEEAKRKLLAGMEKEINSEIGGIIRRSQEAAKEAAEREATRITALAIQRYAASHANEMMTSAVSLPSDEMKGRIIGREGRNIRSLEAATGINILIDDTPEAVVISGFDPIRREVARQALEQLVLDGRIHPARIEEVVAKARENLDVTICKAGEEALYLLGLQGVDPELVRRLGRLKYRTSYTQNVLQHSMEVARLMAVMASELNLDAMLAKRIGVFHDIGKALDHEVEGGHAIIGADLLKRHGEPQVVVNAVASHHEEVPAESPYAVLAAAADAISGSRVGARAETTEVYVKRLEKLEGIANSFAGVDRSYAIQAGREIRVVVQPDRVDDGSSMVMARDISKKIEAEMQYPGQIKVVVIRETRCVEYAH